MKSKLLLLILGVTISILTQAQNTTIAYEGFDYTVGSGISGQSGGIGWALPWHAQADDATIYDIQTANPINYTGLLSTAAHIEGPEVWKSCWRKLDVTQFSSYLDATNNIGANGTTLYYSMLLRKEAANSEPSFVLFSQDITWENLEDSRYSNAVALGFLGGRGNFWSLRVGSTIVDVAPMTVGVPVLLVAKFTFGTTNTVDVYVNPIISNGEPITSQGSASSTSSISFNRLGYLGGYTSNASLDEIRFGNSFTAAVPTSNSIVTTPLAWGISGSAGTNPLINYLGTTDNNDLNIKTNNVNRINVAKTGEVTINSLNGTGSSIPALDATGKLSRIGNGTTGQYLQYTANGPAWSNVNTDWTGGTFTSPNPAYPGTLVQLTNNWKHRVTLLSAQTQVVGELVAWQGIQVGGRDLYQYPVDKVNGMPWYGMGLVIATPTNGFNYSPVQVAGYNGIVMVDNTASSGPALKIQNGNVGIATGYNTTLDQKFTVNGNLKILTTGNGIVFPDGTIQTTAGMNGSGSGDSFWNTAFTTSYTYTCGTYIAYLIYGQYYVWYDTPVATFTSDHDQSSVKGNPAANATYTSCHIIPGSGQQVINTAIETSKDVGIGITSPLSKLHVVGDLRVSGTTTSFVGGTIQKILFGQGNNDNTDPLWISRYNISNAAREASNPLNVSDLTELRINIGDDGQANEDALAIGYTEYGSTSWIEAMKIFSNGNVRIAGKVLSRDIKVVYNPMDPSVSFPDYVFDETYKLTSLEKLRAYIKINKHLPEIPSAADVAKEGSISLGEMNLLLLKKIEELTLYTLDQDIKYKELLNRMDKLETTKNK